MSTELGLHNLRVLDQLEEGDIVEFKKWWLSSHYGVYVGHSDIVHVRLLSDGEALFDTLPEGIGVAKKENFWDVAGASKAYKQNIDDGTLRSLDSKTVVERAMSEIDAVFSYRLCNKQFTYWCRYGMVLRSEVEPLVQIFEDVGYYIDTKILGPR
ncbi:hypothetical protein SNE40_019452 [Patella caerulea]|uniref:LRAT domain-containing protein n=1 Tax=Patella caerulea TaxID=87958 RepID=A0AAN8J779_PATCE